MERTYDWNNCRSGTSGTGRAGAGTGRETVGYRTGTEMHELCGSLVFYGDRGSPIP